MQFSTTLVSCSGAELGYTSALPMISAPCSERVPEICAPWAMPGVGSNRTLGPLGCGPTRISFSPTFCTGRWCSVMHLMWLLRAVRGSSTLPRLPVAGLTEEPQADSAIAATNGAATIAIRDLEIAPRARAEPVGTGMRREGRG